MNVRFSAWAESGAVIPCGTPPAIPCQRLVDRIAERSRDDPRHLFLRIDPVFGFTVKDIRPSDRPVRFTQRYRDP